MVVNGLMEALKSAYEIYKKSEDPFDDKRSTD